jgi:hypothetical protein
MEPPPPNEQNLFKEPPVKDVDDAKQVSISCFVFF